MANEKTIVGIPFYDGEGKDVLTACLSNLDTCLNILNVDAKVIVGINGPRVSMGGVPLSYQIDKSKFNAKIHFIKTLPGLVAAEKEICRRAIQEEHARIFLTDSDISRLPRALINMWQYGDKPVVGANYATYPLETLDAAGVNLSSNEITLMKIFEADKHPLAREFTWNHRPQKRLKGSLLLVDPKIGQRMFGDQGITSDSRMNDIVPETDKQVVNQAAYMHYARISLTDHIQARLRHFRAAAVENNLDRFSNKSIMYGHKTADEIAARIVQKYPEATDVASDFLLQCALRHQVTTICRAVVSGKELDLKPRSDYEMSTTTHARNFKEASQVISNMFSEVDLDKICTPITDGKGTTQNDQRVPIDLGPFLLSEWHRRIILSHLGLDKDAEI